jgi:hypothetical protein
MIFEFIRRLRGDSFGDDAHNVGIYECVIRDVDIHRVTPWGKRTVQSPEIRGPEDHGYGDLTSAAWDEVEERIDPESVDPGTHVATITVDLDLWEYRVEFTGEGR